MPFVMATISSNGDELKREFTAVMALCQVGKMLFSARRTPPHLCCNLVNTAVAYYEATPFTLHIIV